MSPITSIRNSTTPFAGQKLCIFNLRLGSRLSRTDEGLSQLRQNEQRRDVPFAGAGDDSEGAELAGLGVGPVPGRPNNANTTTRSTGPRTPEGKATSSRNALKHGFTAANPAISSEDREAWEALFASYIQDFQPATQSETDAVRRAATALNCGV